METEEEYTRRREEIRRQLSNPEAFDANGRTELNYDAAAVAGAKLLIDETRATRSMCKKWVKGWIGAYSGVSPGTGGDTLPLTKLRETSWWGTISINHSGAMDFRHFPGRVERYREDMWT